MVSVIEMSKKSINRDRDCNSIRSVYSRA